MSAQPAAPAQVGIGMGARMDNRPYVSSIDYEAALETIATLEKLRDRLKEELDYIKSLDHGIAVAHEEEKEKLQQEVNDIRDENTRLRKKVEELEEYDKQREELIDNHASDRAELSDLRKKYQFLVDLVTDAAVQRVQNEKP